YNRYSTSRSSIGDVILSESSLSKVLAEVFGYTTFRDGQLLVIEAVMQQRDALVLMPTGGGKSLCYQLPAVMGDGLTVVISPLIRDRKSTRLNSSHVK